MAKRKKKEHQKAAWSDELEHRFSGLVENSHDGICLLDQDLKVLFRSSSAELINGWNNKERNYYGVVDMVHPRDKKIVRELIKQCFDSPAIPVTTTFRTLHRRGIYIRVACIFTNRLNDDSIKAIVCNFRDITELNKLRK